MLPNDVFLDIDSTSFLVNGGIVNSEVSRVLSRFKEIAPEIWAKSGGGPKGYDEFVKGASKCFEDVVRDADSIDDAIIVGWFRTAPMHDNVDFVCEIGRVGRIMTISVGYGNEEANQWSLIRRWSIEKLEDIH